jgi:uncharacterized membrane protein
LTVRLSYALLLTGYFGIMLLLPAWYGWLSPPQLITPKAALLLLGVPLFLPLRGLLHARRYTVAWSLFLSLLYLTHGCMESYSNAEARWLALAEVGLALCWIAGGIVYLRSSRSSPAFREQLDQDASGDH